MMLRWTFNSRGVTLIILLTSYHTTATGLVTVKNVSIIGTQTNPQVSGISRDGGASVLLSGKVLWLFDDTTTTSDSGRLLNFVSNSAATGTDPNNVTSLQEVSVAASIPHDQDGTPTFHGNDTPNAWIPLLSNETDYNQKQPRESRIAMWPGSNPVAVSPVLAYLWAPAVLVSNGTNHKAGAKYTYLYTNVVKIEDTMSGMVAARLVDGLFAADDRTEWVAPFGCFAAIVGRSSECHDIQSMGCASRVVYLLGAGSDGLQLARVALSDVGRPEASYGIWQPSSCRFGTSEDEPKPPVASVPYLRGTFSSGSVFWSPYFKTFLMVYMNAYADSTLYLRYLNLTSPTCTSNDSIWQRSGIHANRITAEDAEALIHYAWSEPQVLFVTSAPTGGTLRYNYAGVAHPEFFNRQYYQKWMYANGGIDSAMRGPWLGREIVKEDDAGGDGKHLMMSWTTLGEMGYAIVMAMVEFERPEENGGGSGGQISVGTAIVAGACVLVLL